MASYNYEPYLRECIQSALDQEGVDVDVTVVDDGSADGSVALATEMASLDPRIRVIVHKQNMGHIVTFNESLWAGSGEFIVKLDSDDMLTPGSLGALRRRTKSKSFRGVCIRQSNYL